MWEANFLIMDWIDYIIRGISLAAAIFTIIILIKARALLKRAKEKLRSIDNDNLSTRQNFDSAKNKIFDALRHKFPDGEAGFELYKKWLEGLQLTQSELIFEGQSYEIVIGAKGAEGIKCKKCKLTSWNKNDVKFKWCDHCKITHL